MTIRVSGLTATDAIDSLREALKVLENHGLEEAKIMGQKSDYYMRLGQGWRVSYDDD